MREGARERATKSERESERGVLVLSLSALAAPLPLTGLRPFEKKHGGPRTESIASENSPRNGARCERNSSACSSMATSAHSPIRTNSAGWLSKSCGASRSRSPNSPFTCGQVQRA